MKRSFEKFQKTPLVMAISLMLLSAIVLVLVYTFVQKGNMAANELAKKWQAESSKLEEVHTLERNLKSLENERLALASHFIDSADVVPFLDTIEKLAPRVGAKAQVTMVDIAKDKKSLTVGINADGSFAALYKFVKLLENSPYQIEFISMNLGSTTSISESGETSPSGSWTGVFSIKLLSFLE